MHRVTEASSRDEHAIGPVDAPVQLVEFGDYECGRCARAHFEVAEVLHQHGDIVRYTFRHFPLVRIHPNAFLAAQAAEAAGRQGRFWAMHSMLFVNHHALTPETFSVYANTLGLDAFRFARELQTGIHAPKVTSDLWCGARSGVDTAPCFFLDGVRLDGTWSAARVGAAIRAHVSSVRMNAFTRLTP